MATKRPKKGRDKAAVTESPEMWRTRRQLELEQEVETLRALVGVGGGASAALAALDSQYQAEAMFLGEGASSASGQVTEFNYSRDLADDEAGWSRVGGLLGAVGPTSYNRERVIRQAYYLFERNPFGRNIINVYTFLTLGSGIKVAFEDPDAQRLWDEDLAPRLKWDERVRRIVRLTYLFGEYFVLRMPLCDGQCLDTKTGRVDRERLKAWLAGARDRLALNELDPLEIPTIIPADQNREEAKAYKLATDMEVLGGERDRFAADDVTYFAVYRTGATTQHRGHPVLEPALKDISLLNMYDLDRVTRNAIRTRIPLIRKVPGLRRQGVKNAMELAGLPRPGSVAIVSKDEEWLFPTMGADGGTANRERRALILRIATAVSLPEYLVSMDASNSNLASLLAASGPLVPMFTDLRQAFARQFEALIEEVVGERPTITYSQMVRESVEALVKAYSQMYRDGVVSRQTYQAAVGLDPEDEAERIQSEIDDLANPHDYDEEPPEEEPEPEVPGGEEAV